MEAATCEVATFGTARVILPGDSASEKPALFWNRSMSVLHRSTAAHYDGTCTTGTRISLATDLPDRAHSRGTVLCGHGADSEADSVR